MGLDTFAEILKEMSLPLDQYLQDPTRHADEVNAPTASSSLPNKEFNMYNVMFKRLFVASHDYGDESGKDGTHITLIRRDIFEVAKASKSMFDSGSVQFGCDFFDIPGTDLKLGHGGYYDFGGHYWPSVFVISKHESKHFSLQIMEALNVLHTHLNSATDSEGKLECLSDAAQALKSACDQVGILVRRCFAHVTRLPDGTKRNSKQGVKGSLARYLLREFKLSKKEMTKV